MKILITGGSRGIGEACVRAFCQQGDSVAFLYRSNHERAKKLAEETGAIAIAADVSDAESATAATKEAIERLGGIDVLVNNAGTNPGVWILGSFCRKQCNPHKIFIPADIIFSFI